MVRSCIACGGTSSAPTNFLLTCLSCATSYHHRCHSPVIPDPLLRDLVQASTALAKGLASARDGTKTLQNWKCASCSGHSTIPSALSPALIDLTISDSDTDGDSPAKLQQVEDKSVKQADIKPAHTERVKVEEVPSSLSIPHRKSNIAPAWIHKQYADSQATDAWDRLASKNRSRRPRKVIEPAAKSITSQPFSFVAPLWLESRRSTLPI